jgi:hypothetical protein
LIYGRHYRSCTWIVVLSTMNSFSVEFHVFAILKYELVGQIYLLIYSKQETS